jgi:hypothetical protein
MKFVGQRKPMATKRQVLGRYGEMCVVSECACPKCKRSRTLKRLPLNFKCADVICDFCGYLAQVKAVSVDHIDIIPKTVLNAAWGPQRDQYIFPSLLSWFLGNDTPSSIYRPTYKIQKCSSRACRFPSAQSVLDGRALSTA